jgi:hypothetical protein
MFSNDVKTVLENTIIEFNTALQNKAYYKTDYDIKNMLFQLLKKHLKATEYMYCLNYLDFKVIKKLEIINGNIVNLVFDQYNTYNKNIERLLDILNYEISNIDLDNLATKSLAIADISDVFTNFISKTNNYNIK